jgi:hypothetical protein
MGAGAEGRLFQLRRGDAEASPAPLRNRTFFGLDELNAAMAEKLAELNNRPLSADSTQTRASLFAEHEKPKLKKLPSEPFEIGRWHRFKLGSDYHVCINGVAYSAPSGLIGIFHQGGRPAPEGACSS